jgi:hypothetical protein
LLSTLVHFRLLVVFNASIMWNIWKIVLFYNLKLAHVSCLLLCFLSTSCCFDRRWSWLLGFDILHHIASWCDARDVFSADGANPLSFFHLDFLTMPPDLYLNLQNPGYFLYLLQYMNFKFLMLWICCQLI